MTEIRVYLVDNEKNKAELYKASLENSGKFSICIIDDERGWREIFDNGVGTSAILCIDQSLNHWNISDGIILGGKFKKRWKYTPLIIYSSFASNHDEAYAAGAQYYLPREVVQDSDLFSRILCNCVERTAETLRLDTYQALIDDLPMEFMLVDNEYRVVIRERRKSAGKTSSGKNATSPFTGERGLASNAPYAE
jgi:hypothetical protein